MPYEQDPHHVFASDLTPRGQLGFSALSVAFSGLSMVAVVGAMVSRSASWQTFLVLLQKNLFRKP